MVIGFFTRSIFYRSKKLLSIYPVDCSAYRATDSAACWGAVRCRLP